MMYIIFTEHREDICICKIESTCKASIFQWPKLDNYTYERWKKVPKLTPLKRRAPSFYILCKTRQELIPFLKNEYGIIKIFLSYTRTNIAKSTRRERLIFFFKLNHRSYLYNWFFEKNARISIREDIFYQFISLFNYDETTTFITKYKWWS